jgi:hypothetical protein
MRVEPAAKSKSAEASKVWGVLQHALENSPASVARAHVLVDSLAHNPRLQVVVLCSAGPETRLVADMVTRLATGEGLPKAAVCSSMNRAQTSWPTLSRTHGARSIALLEDGETVETTLITAWLRKLVRDDHENATVFVEVAGSQQVHNELIGAVKTLATEHHPLVDLHVIDVSDSRPL